MKKSNYYYDIKEDIKAYPHAWVYLIIGGRNTGKTYSTLKSCVVDKRDFVFLKRTIEDVELLCAGSGKVGSKQNEFGVDLSPFKSVNRDLLTDIRAYSIKKGLGAFWKHLDGEMQGSPIGYLLALNAVSKYKGFDLSSSNDEQWLIFDEFIRQPWEREQTKREGEQLMDLYKTISRDREHRGLQPLKLICLANATSISNQIFAILEVTDIVAGMEVSKQESIYIEDRGIFIRKLKDNEEFEKKEKDSPIYKAMGDTAWGKMAFDNSFAYNDFSSIGRTSLKGYRPVCSVSYKNDNYYIYQKEAFYYMTLSRHNGESIYNLNRENDQKLFSVERLMDLRQACIEGKMLFETYTMYDLIINYRRFFSL